LKGNPYLGDGAVVHHDGRTHYVDFTVIRNGQVWFTYALGGGHIDGDLLLDGHSGAVHLRDIGGLLVHEGWHMMEIFTTHPGNTTPYNTYPWNQAEGCLRTL